MVTPPFLKNLLVYTGDADDFPDAFQLSHAKRRVVVCCAQQHLVNSAEGMEEEEDYSPQFHPAGTVPLLPTSL